MRVIGISLVLLIASCITCKAQDPHFSQYFSSPLTLNPATTGFFDGDYRIALNERQQWWNIGASYNTTSLSADFKILSEQIPQFDTFGVGFSGIFDKSLNGALYSNYLSASVAYHKSLADEGKQTLALGIQATFADRFIDFSKLSFASQFNVDFFDPSLPVNIGNSYNDTKYLEINAGLLYTLHINKDNYYLGTSLYHINRPIERIYDPAGYKVPFRITAHSGGEININSLSSVLFSGVYMNQGGIYDNLIGAAYAFKLDNDFDYTKIYLGAWYRVNESYIPYIGIDFNNFSAGVNYSLSALSVNSYHPATFEFSLIFKHRSNSNSSSLCPRF
jgi:type IX secretion system PorP/SprF family membrane protein